MVYLLSKWSISNNLTALILLLTKIKDAWLMLSAQKDIELENKPALAALSRELDIFSSCNRHLTFGLICSLGPESKKV